MRHSGRVKRYLKFLETRPADITETHEEKSYLCGVVDALAWVIVQRKTLPIPFPEKTEPVVKPKTKRSHKKKAVAA